MDFNLTGKTEESEKKSILDSVMCAVDVEVKDTDWAIKNVMARGALTIVAGQTECGKSTLLSHLCVDLAAGRPTILDDYDKFEGRAPMRCMYIDAEEAESVVVKRFQQMGANRNVFVLNKRDALVAELTTTSPLMRELVEGFRPDVLVLSPISSFLPARCNATKKKDVVQALRPILDLADEFNIAVAIIQHTNKVKDTDYRKCISDSSYFSEAPRNVIMLGRTQNKGEVFVSVEKGSLTSVYEPYKTRILRFRRDVQAFDVVGVTDMRWRDFVLQAQGQDIADCNRAASRAEKSTKLAETKNIIVQTLTECGPMERDKCMSQTQEAGASSGSWEKAIRELKEEGVITSDAVWNGRVKSVTYRLVGQSETQTETEDECAIFDILNGEGGAA